MTRAFWLRQLHSWHWISAALSLTGMLLFAVTGLTLNHAASLSASPSRQERQAEVPARVQAALQALPEGGDTPVPPALARWAADAFAIDIASLPAEVDGDAVFITVPRPGGEGTLRLDRATASARYTATSRGWVAYFNDLHKGRNAGQVWFWFIDGMAASCIVFTLTGFALLWMHGRARPFTWPLTGLSLLAPVLIALLFVHG
ncbi:membrane protein [Pseudorhodoferax aquiterrae]|uniref:Membrane protein n=1 Tax=Pseudorhodoferax aquiterrae TaxID=747304 RepID=A0ABQ3G9Q2_9BURK|nr:PepSY-associated TM helix domain-containing protein [Pseudorhodoferax aquiterrae]GHC97412.1 membrane protein [Pseudorhodoferax aquiterrae]